MCVCVCECECECKCHVTKISCHGLSRMSSMHINLFICNRTKNTIPPHTYTCTYTCHHVCGNVSNSTGYSIAKCECYKDLVSQIYVIYLKNNFFITFNESYNIFVRSSHFPSFKIKLICNEI